MLNNECYVCFTIDAFVCIEYLGLCAFNSVQMYYFNARLIAFAV